MPTKYLIHNFERGIDRLIKELQSYEDESRMWIIEGQINNSAGNLALHLIGNLNHFIGAIIGKNGYIRDRETEFNAKDVPCTELVAQLAELKQIVSSTLSPLQSGDLEKPYPIDVLGFELSVGMFVTHLLSHFNYHFGQISYHRRFLDRPRNA